MKVSFTLILFLFLFFLSVYSQTLKGYVRVYVKPGYAIVRLDTLKITQFNTPIELDTGIHTIKMWAPKYELYEKQFSLSWSQTRVISKGLVYCKEYKKYRREISAYYIGKNALRFVLPPITIGFAVSSFLRLKEMEKELAGYYEEAMASKKQYDNSFWPEDIEDAKTKFEADKKNYENQLQKINRYRTISFLGVASGAALSVLGWYFSGRLIKPVYIETPLLSKSDINIYFTGQNFAIGYFYYF